MRIITFSTDEQDVPNSLRHVAYFLQGGEFLPVRTTASTADGARTKAQEFWDTEKSKHLKKQPKPKAAAPAPAPVLSKSPASTFDDEGLLD